MASDMMWVATAMAAYAATMPRLMCWSADGISDFLMSSKIMVMMIAEMSE